MRKSCINKRPMDHIAHLRNQFKSINTFVQSYDLERSKHHLIFIIKWSLFVSFTQGCFLPSLVESDPMVLQKNIFRFRQCLFRNYLPPWKQALPFSLESLAPKDTLCRVWLKLAQWFWKRRFSNFVNVFSLFCNNLPQERDVALHLSKLDPLHQRMHCALFG